MLIALLQATQQIINLYNMFIGVDATQVEINPLGETPQGKGSSYSRSPPQNIWRVSGIVINDRIISDILTIMISTLEDFIFRKMIYHMIVISHRSGVFRC